MASTSFTKPVPTMEDHDDGEGTFGSSPTSVIANPNHVVDPIQLDGNHKKEEKVVNEWICPPSAKSLRTKNPIRAIVDPIVQNIKMGSERGDGKDPISLAVRTKSTI
jgi:hypothetical protein